MKKIELSLDGLQKLDKHIARLQDKTVKGIVSRRDADRCLKEIRSLLFELLQIIRSECVIVNDTSGPAGPDAA